MSRNFRTVKPRFWVLVIGLLAIGCTIAYSAQQRYIRQQNEMIASLIAERQRIAEENATIQRKIDFTYTEEYIEREARSNLGLIKEGEILFESNDE